MSCTIDNVKTMPPTDGLTNVQDPEAVGGQVNTEFPQLPCQL